MVGADVRPNWKEAEAMAAIAQLVTTAVLGAFAVYIAWRQWRTARDRLTLDLFDRRFQTFQDLTRTVSVATNKPRTEINDLGNFDQAFEGARFLFGPEVHGYLREVPVHLVNLTLHEMDGAQRTNAENKLSAAEIEMSAFYARLGELVTPYLRMPLS